MNFVSSISSILHRMGFLNSTPKKLIELWTLTWYFSSVCQSELFLFSAAVCLGI
jgi:hypothetical protein